MYYERCCTCDMNDKRCYNKKYLIFFFNVYMTKNMPENDVI